MLLFLFQKLKIFLKIACSIGRLTMHINNILKKGGGDEVDDSIGKEKRPNPNSG